MDWHQKVEFDSMALRLLILIRGFPSWQKLSFGQPYLAHIPFALADTLFEVWDGCLENRDGSVLWVLIELDQAGVEFCCRSGLARTERGPDGPRYSGREAGATICIAGRRCWWGTIKQMGASSRIGPKRQGMLWNRETRLTVDHGSATERVGEFAR